MSIVSTDLVAYGSANRPTDDASTVGGAISTTVRPVFTQFTASAKLSLTSSAADTRSATITGRDGSGVYLTESVTLNGTTEVLSVNTYQRILSVSLSTSNGSNTVTLKQGSGGSTVSTIPPNETGVFAMFIQASSNTTTQTRYEKLFLKNTNGSTTLTSAQVTLTADPQATMQIGLAAAVNDTATATNRMTAPAGVVFSGVNVAISIPSGSLTSTQAIGVWLQQTLAANASSVLSTFTTQLSGQTT